MMLKKQKRKIIMLALFAILVTITSSIALTYSYLSDTFNTNNVTTATIQNCAKIKLIDTSSAISLTNSIPMSKNVALNSITPYTFNVSSSCENYIGFDLYIGIYSNNTISPNEIRYIITEQGSKNVLHEGLINNGSNNITNSLTNEEKNQFKNGTSNYVNAYYRIYNEDIPIVSNKSYDLYLFVDADVTINSARTFNAGVGIKAYDRAKSYIDYRLLDGPNYIYTPGENLVINTDSELTNFDKILINDIELNSSDYNIASNTKFTISSDYLETLTPDTYTIKLVFNSITLNGSIVISDI